MKPRWRERAERKAAEWFEVPRDTLAHVPRITLVGDGRVTVENFQRLRELSSEELLLQTAIGDVSIRGAALRVSHMVAEQLVVEGRIAAVTLQEREAGKGP
ncbi:MAG: YabP/YqfC family sporulation protein [Firmicutes bacterium]|nr:YabP/YqfC family sporulation protein [Bacillota bacterium]